MYLYKVMPFVFLGSCALALASILSAIIFKNPKLVWAVIPMYLLGFFIGEDTLWPAKLLWNENLFITMPLLAIYGVLEALFIFKLSPSFRWLNGAHPGTTGPMEKKQTKNPLLLVVVAFAFIFTLWIPYQGIQVLGYFLNNEPVEIRSSVLDTGTTHGKYHRHRFWHLQTAKGDVTYWIYAGSNASSGKNRDCNTAADPENGSKVVIAGRSGAFGTSVAYVSEIKDRHDHVTCDHSKYH